MKENYEISRSTCAVSYVDEETCLVDEGEKIKINMPLVEFLDYNCAYYGSSFHGRIKGSEKMLGAKYKVPIVIEESSEIIFFPTKSYNNEKCIYISLNNILKYEKDNNKTKILFKNGKEETFDISIESFENQFLRAIQLNLILKKRKLAQNRL